MYRLVIADDEPWITYRLSHLVDYHALGFELVETVADGPSALEMCLAHQADVLLTDIRMPGMDGLELLHALREKHLQTEVVLISGYAEFAYAQTALRDGAFDYLVKQVSEKQLESVLTRLKAHLDHQHAQDQALLNIEALFSLFNDEDLTVSQWVQQYFHPLDQNWICFACSTVVPENALLSLRCGQHTFCTLLACPDGQTIPLSGQQAAGFSSIADQGALASELYRQSSMAYLTSVFHGGCHPYCYQAGMKADVSNLLQALEDALQNRDYVQCQASLRNIEEHAYSMGINQLAKVYNQLCRLFDHHFPSMGLSDEDVDYRQLVQMFASVKDIFAFFQSCVCNFDSAEEGQFEPVLRHIDACLSQELRITELAERFHFSPSYFSTLFHKHVGMTFTKYLAQKRMERARSLMGNKQLSLHEIAEQCGYSDYFQFNKTFKRYFAVSPGQYRKQR